MSGTAFQPGGSPKQENFRGERTAQRPAACRWRFCACFAAFFSALARARARFCAAFASGLSWRLECRACIAVGSKIANKITAAKNRFKRRSYASTIGWQQDLTLVHPEITANIRTRDRDRSLDTLACWRSSGRNLLSNVPAQPRDSEVHVEPLNFGYDCPRRRCLKLLFEVGPGP